MKINLTNFFNAFPFSFYITRVSHLVREPIDQNPMERNQSFQYRMYIRSMLIWNQTFKFYVFFHINIDCIYILVLEVRTLKNGTEMEPTGGPRGTKCETLSVPLPDGLIVNLPTMPSPSYFTNYSEARV